MESHLSRGPQWHKTETDSLYSGLGTLYCIKCFIYIHSMTEILLAGIETTTLIEAQATKKSNVQLCIRENHVVKVCIQR